MKKGLLFVLVSMGLTLFSCSYESDEYREKNYCGVVVEKYITGKGDRYIVIYHDSLGKKLNLYVTGNEYVNADSGKVTCILKQKRFAEH